MNLVVDIGNTLCKWALVQDGRIEKKGVGALFNQCLVESLIAKGYKIERIVLSSVRELSEHLMLYLQDNYKYTQLDYTTQMPIKINYSSPKTLGVDRIAAAIGAASIFPKKACLIIDAGSAITIDFKNSNDEFEGGNISPGINMRYRALHKFTDKLPRVEFRAEYNELGKDTESAIRAGVQQAVIYEIDGYVEAAKTKYPDVQLLLTGGDAAFINEHLANKFTLEPDLVLKGLIKLI